MNPLFGGMGNIGNAMQILAQLKQDPVSVLRQAGYNVPGNVGNPQQIIQYLMNSGQVNQNQLNQAQQMAQMFNGLK